MTTPANQSGTQSGSVTPRPANQSGTQTGKIPTKGAKKKYDWGDGRKVHTIPKPTRGKPDPKAPPTNDYSPYDLSKDQTPEQVKSAVENAMDTQYAAPINTAQQGIKDSQLRETVDIPAWYKQYTDALAAAQTKQQQDYANASANATVAPTAPTGDKTVDDAAAVRDAAQNNFANMIRGQGANNVSATGTQITSASLHQAGAMGEEERNRQGLTASLGALQKERGAYGNTYLQGLRSSYATSQNDAEANRIASAIAGVKAQEDSRQFDATLSQTAKDKAAERKIQKDKIKSAEKIANEKAAAGEALTPTEQKTLADLAYFKKHGYYPQTGPGKKDKAGTVSPTAQRASQNAWDGAIAYMRSNKNSPDFTKITTADIQTDAKAPYDVANIAEYYAHKGKGTITFDMASKLKKLGIKFPSKIVRG